MSISITCSTLALQEAGRLLRDLWEYSGGEKEEIRVVGVIVQEREGGEQRVASADAADTDQISVEVV